MKKVVALLAMMFGFSTFAHADMSQTTPGATDPAQQEMQKEAQPQPQQQQGGNSANNAGSSNSMDSNNSQDPDDTAS